MLKKEVFIALSVVILVGGCARTPDVSVRYFQPKTSIGFTVVRTVACTADDKLVIENGVSPTVSTSADREAMGSVDLSKLDGFLASSEISFTLRSDGRLQGTTVKTIGKAGEIGKAVLKLAATVGSFSNTNKFPLVCAYIREEAVKAKSVGVTLKYSGSVDATALTGTKDREPSLPAGFELQPDAATDDHLAAASGQLRLAVGEVQGKVAKFGSSKPPVMMNSDNPADTEIVMRSILDAAIEVRLGVGARGVRQYDWESTVPVLSARHTYSIPIPQAALFGQQKFELAIDDSGMVTKIAYDKTNGATDAIGLGQAIVDELKPDSAKDRAAALNAEADLIKAQQRLIKCKLDPTTCS